jgi:hypothetical protein
MIPFSRSMLLSVMIITFLSSFIYGQNISVDIHVANAKHEPVSFASLTLKSLADSTFSIGSLTDSNAASQLQLFRFGFYELKVSSIG